jgi:hypothetical protein
MPRTIAINGTRLDKVHMLVEPFSKGVISSLRYPTSQIRYSRDEGTLRLVLPAYLSVELYRIGILPQDVNTPVRISIGGRPVGRYIVSDVRYPIQSNSPFGHVTFTLPRVLQRNARSAGEQPLSQPAAAVSTKYVTDITHYLDETGELAQLPGPARGLASFLTLLIEAATGAPSAGEHDSGIRCMAKACRGTIRTSLPPGQDEILWHCRACGLNGVIRNWDNTKWNQLKRIEETGAC